MGVFKTLTFVLNHPLNRDHRIEALMRVVRWQLGSRLVPGPVVVDFVDESKLLIEPGMTGATGNVYTGLHEFWEMAFTLHLLRKGDLFVDVGANVGVYTILASAAVGARSMSFEPIPSTYDWLAANVRLNGIDDRVETHRSAIGAQEGHVRMTNTLGPVNHVVREEEEGTQVPVQPLDSMLGAEDPTLIKIDVEGYEAEVVKGATRVLASEGLLAAIVEINGQEERYEQDSGEVVDGFRTAGFEPYTYDPLSRRLRMRNLGRPEAVENVLFLKDAESVKARVREARPYRTSTGSTI